MIARVFIVTIFNPRVQNKIVFILNNMDNFVEEDQYILDESVTGVKVAEPVAPNEEDSKSDDSDCGDESGPVFSTPVPIGSITVLPDVSNSGYRELSDIGPYDPKRRYLCVGAGLNIQAKCLNQACPSAFEKKVWIKKGFGIFRIHELKYDLLCPVCNEIIDQNTLSNIGFTKTKISFDGLKINGKIREQVNHKDEEKDGKFLTYMDRSECQVKWGRLTIETLLL